MAFQLFDDSTEESPSSSEEPESGTRRGKNAVALSTVDAGSSSLEINELDRLQARASRAAGKAKRMFMVLPGVKQVAINRYYIRVGQHAFNRPWLPHEAHRNIRTVRETGVAKTVIPLPDNVSSVAEAFVERLRAAPREPKYDRITPLEILSPPDVFLYGLDEALLDIAENFIGLPVSFAGCELKRERPEAPPVDVRMWHLDVEDHRMLKIIVYLSDVDEDCGPFTYLDVADTNHVKRELRYLSGFVDDSTMASIVPRARWRTALGPRLTASWVDTCNVFHKAAQPRVHDRYSMTFSYTSNEPLQLFPEFRQTREQQWRVLRGRLTPRQWDVLQID
jgi:hypothetical protein